MQFLFTLALRHKTLGIIGIIWIICCLLFDFLANCILWRNVLALYWGVPSDTRPRLASKGYAVRASKRNNTRPSLASEGIRDPTEQAGYGAQLSKQEQNMMGTAKRESNNSDNNDHQEATPTCGIQHQTSFHFHSDAVPPTFRAPVRLLRVVISVKK